VGLNGGDDKGATWTLRKRWRWGNGAKGLLKAMRAQEKATRRIDEGAREWRAMIERDGKILFRMLVWEKEGDGPRDGR